MADFYSAQLAGYCSAVDSFTESASPAMMFRGVGIVNSFVNLFADCDIVGVRSDWLFYTACQWAYSGGSRKFVKERSEPRFCRRG